MAPAPKKPNDRQPSKSEILQASAADVAGSDLLTPVTNLRSGRIANLQADFLELFEVLGIDMNASDEDEQQELDLDVTPDVLRAIGRLGDILEGCVPAEKLEAFARFDSGPEAQTKIMELAMWYFAKLGESVSSAS